MAFENILLNRQSLLSDSLNFERSKSGAAFELETAEHV